MGVCNSAERVARQEARQQKAKTCAAASISAARGYIAFFRLMEGVRVSQGSVSPIANDSSRRVGPWLDRLFEGGRSCADKLHRQSSKVIDSLSLHMQKHEVAHAPRDEEVARLNIFAVRMRRIDGVGHTPSLSPCRCDLVPYLCRLLKLCSWASSRQVYGCHEPCQLFVTIEQGQLVVESLDEPALVRCRSPDVARAFAKGCLCCHCLSVGRFFS
jgi:hypothetical protein